MNEFLEHQIQQSILTQPTAGKTTVQRHPTTTKTTQQMYPIQLSTKFKSDNIKQLQYHQTNTPAKETLTTNS